MRYVLFALAFSLVAPALTASAAQRGNAMRKTTAVQAPAQNAGGCYRRVNGDLVWVPQSAASASGPAADNGPRRTTTNDRHRVVTSYPDSARPEVVNGVNWYLNGRSFFSD